MSVQARALNSPYAQRFLFLSLFLRGMGRSFTLLVLLLAAISSHAGTVYVRNNATMTLELSAANDGAVFGGTGDAAKATVAPGSSQTIVYAKDRKSVV